MIWISGRSISLRKVFVQLEPKLWEGKGYISECQASRVPGGPGDPAGVPTAQLGSRSFPLWGPARQRGKVPGPIVPDKRLYESKDRQLEHFSSLSTVRFSKLKKKKEEEMLNVLFLNFTSSCKTQLNCP